MGSLNVLVNGAWKTVSGDGPTGPTGPQGPAVQGPTGPTSSLEDVHVGTAAPTDPSVTLWFHEGYIEPPVPQPIPGGNTDEALTKASDTNEDVVWAGPHLKLSGGTISGDLTTSDLSIDGTLTSPTVAGATRFNNDISANVVTNRTNTYDWERWDPIPNLAPTFSDSTAGSSTVECSPYLVVVSVTLHKTGVKPGDVWVPVLATPMPQKYRPAHDLWTVRTGTEELSDPGSIFEIRVTTDGHLWYSELTDTLDHQDNTYIPIFFTYPRAFA